MRRFRLHSIHGRLFARTTFNSSYQSVRQPWNECKPQLLQQLHGKAVSYIYQVRRDGSVAWSLGKVMAHSESTSTPLSLTWASYLRSLGSDLLPVACCSSAREPVRRSCFDGLHIPSKDACEFTPCLRHQLSPQGATWQVYEQDRLGRVGLVCRFFLCYFPAQRARPIECSSDDTLQISMHSHELR